ncbi:MAG: hypothetical protein KF862_07105 [Chitinophagaceae bacterium]|nr:hypothetical protein [Chitinophagaceae bacterium]
MANIEKKWRRGRKGVDWTPAMIKELKKLYENKTQKELAYHFSCTLSALKGALTRFSIKRKRIRGWTAKEDTYLLKNWNYITKEELAAHFGKTRSAIIRRHKSLLEDRY